MATRTRARPQVDEASVRGAVDGFLSSPRCANPNTRRAYTGVLDRVLDEIGAEVELGQVSGEQLAEVLERLWKRSPATWDRNRAAVAAWLSWCARAGHAGPALSLRTARRREPADVRPALSRTTLERALSRRDVPLREKTLWRMLFRDRRPRKRGPRRLGNGAAKGRYRRRSLVRRCVDAGFSLG